MRNTWIARLVAVVVAGAIAPTDVFAQAGSDIAARRDLLERAEAARHANDHVHALDFANRAGRLSMTPSLRMFIAAEQNALNQFADALGSAEQCVHDADADQTLRNRAEILNGCNALVQQLRNNVGRVTVDVSQPAPSGMQIHVNSNLLNDAFWGVPYVVTPGTVVIEASAPGYVSSRQEIAVATGAVVDVPVTLHTQSEAHAAVTTSTSTASTPAEQSHPTPATTSTSPTAPTTATQSSASQPRSESSPQEARSSSGSIVPPLVVALFGVASLGASLAFAILKGNTTSTLDQMCIYDMGTGCPATSQGLISDANLFNTLMDTTLIVGGVAVIAGVLWFVVGRGHHENPGHAMLRLSPTPGGFSLGFGGAL